MKKRKTFIGIALLIVVLLLGIGYAAIGNITLNITGSASATANDDNFVVKFTDDTIEKNGSGSITATKTGDTNAEITVTGLTKKGETATATYTISNDSPDLSADLSAALTETETKTPTSTDNIDYFDVTYKFNKTAENEGTETASIEAGKTATITVTVELKETPVEYDVTSNITVAITAKPVQP